jgi:hypothetical protein
MRSSDRRTAAFIGNARVRVECDVGDGVSIGDEIVMSKSLLRHAKGIVAALEHPLRKAHGARPELGELGMDNQVAVLARYGLMPVLLKQHPLKEEPGTVEAFAGLKRRALREYEMMALDSNRVRPASLGPPEFVRLEICEESPACESRQR